MNVKRFNEKVNLTKGYTQDGGYDISLSKNFILQKGNFCIDLEVAVQIPNNYIGIIVPRSSLALKGVYINTCIIDSGYTGTIHAIGMYTNDTPLKLNIGDRLCSLVVIFILNEPITYVDDLPHSDRDDKKFGSTNRKEVKDWS